MSNHNTYGAVRWLVGNIHVATSDKKVLREFWNRLNSNPANMTLANRQERKELYRYVLKCHHENQQLYSDVMSGNL